MITEYLSMRLLILQCMFSVGGLWLQLLSCLGMQLKVWLVHKHPSHFSTSKWQKIVTKKELGDWYENGSEDREPKFSHYP